MNLKTLAYAGLGLAGSSVLAYQYMVSLVDRKDFPLTDMDEVGTATILLPTLNEAAWVRSTLESLEKQNVRQAFPDRFELIVVDSDSDDGTQEIAREFTSKVFTTPKGKLTSIDMGIQKARGNIIVGVDGDSSYGFNFLNLLLRHFQNSDVVAVSGAEIQTGSLWTVLGSLWFEWVFCAVNPRLMGRGAAYSKSAYHQIGGFNLNINQLDPLEMISEEEWGFRRRLQQVGRYVFDRQAVVFTSPRRIWCVLGGKFKRYCEDKECMAMMRYCEEMSAGLRF